MSWTVFVCAHRYSYRIYSGCMEGRKLIPYSGTTAIIYNKNIEFNQNTGTGVTNISRFDIEHY